MSDENIHKSEGGNYLYYIDGTAFSEKDLFNALTALVQRNGSDFNSVNNFVHDTNIEYEDLQVKCLGLAAECERLRDLVKKAYWEGVETQYGHSGPLHILTAWSTSSVKNQLQEIDND